MSQTIGGRLAYADLLRCTAMLAVIVVHITGGALEASPVGTPDFMVLNVYDGLTHWCVPVFVMLSGMFLLDPKHSLPPSKLFFGHMLRIAAALAVWGTAYALVERVQVHGLSWESVRAALYQVLLGKTCFHLWFLYMLLGLYLVTPVLRAFVRGAGRGDFHWFFLLVFVFTFLLPTLLRLRPSQTVSLYQSYLNIKLVLGYVAFYAVGAYSYALLNQAFGLGFWACLPVGGFMAIVFGLALGFPVLRLRGDYLAIVTLGFGEIVRLVLLNWTSLTGGSGGIKNIPGPSFFGQELEIAANTIFIYYLVLLAVILTIIVISRLKNSRVGLALQALREDEIACEAMGIDLARVKLSAFALSSCWAGFAGVIFAAKTTFINPASFTFMESAMILSMVVLGGMGSIVGVVIAATILILAPEYLRAFSEYRMLIFGAIMVIMMIFRPQGLVTGERRRYRITALQGDSKGERA